MTEAEWLECDDADEILKFLRNRASDRRLRLFACACCRQIWRLIRDPACQRAVETSELYSDGAATIRQLGAVARRANQVAADLAFEATVMMRLANWAARDAARAAAMVATKRRDPSAVAAHARSAVAATPDRPKDQAALLRDIIGNPFHTRYPADPNVLAWNEGTVRRIAQAIYDERAFDRLPILADALLDAGCEDEDLLAHCRSPGPHVCGCWAIDLILGKE